MDENENNIPEGLPFYIEVYQEITTVPEADEPKEEREKLHDTSEEEEKKAITVSIYKKGEEKICLAGLDELKGLIETAGGTVSAIVTQMRPAPDSRFGVGSGKITEIARAAAATDATLVVFDFELSPIQIREIEKAVNELEGVQVSVIDRTMLILDIFAMRAQSAEGRLQVELAQLKYTAPRLMGKGKDMSRLGGGIGTRGPGESKLEIDRRRTRERINILVRELKNIEKNRSILRQKRLRSEITKCAIVGYTNAGKSTLLNYLTNAGILAEDKLFATLDPTTRQYTLPGGTKILLTDTVGFINKLPHQLVKAFKSTLDEAVIADVLIIVIDASDDDFADRLAVTEELLGELEARNKPTLYVFNKCDKVEDEFRMAQMKKVAATSDASFAFISAEEGEGIEEMLDNLERLCRGGKKLAKVLLPQSRGDILSLIYRDGENVDVSYKDDGMEISVICDEKLRGRLKEFLIDE